MYREMETADHQRVLGIEAEDVPELLLHLHPEQLMMW